MTLKSLINQARRYLAPNNVDCVLYHSPCFDGFAAALAAWNALGTKVLYIPVNYESELVIQDKLRGKNVLVVDFSFPKAALETLRTYANKVMILDHHKTALEQLANTEGAYIDLTHSGAVLSFEYFNVNNEIMPKFYSLIEDTDLWKWALENESKPLRDHLIQELDNAPNPFDFDFRQYQPLLTDNELNLAIQHGKKLKEQNDLWIAKTAQDAKHGILSAFGHEYAIAYLELQSATLISELGDYLCNNTYCEFAMLYFRTENGTYKVSLRSKGETDVAKIAELFDGGGHRNAAGFYSTTHPKTLLK